MISDGGKSNNILLTSDFTITNNLTIALTCALLKDTSNKQITVGIEQSGVATDGICAQYATGLHQISTDSNQFGAINYMSVDLINNNGERPGS